MKPFLLWVGLLFFLAPESESPLHTAFLFTGFPRYINVPNPSNIFDLQTFTFEVWIKRTALNNGTHNSDIIASAGTKGWGVSIDQNECLYFSSIDEGRITCNHPIKDFNWHHIAVTCANNKVSFFIDGAVYCNQIQLNATATKNFVTTFESNTNYCLGGRASVTPNVLRQNFFQGAMDEVRIWSTIRTIDEITVNKNKELTGNEPGLMLYYNFNETSGSKLEDLTHNGNNGTLAVYPSGTFDASTISADSR